MTNATWQVTASDGNYNNTLNWTGHNIPGASDTAYFGTSSKTSISNIDNNVGGWTFNPGAPAYSFSVSFALVFYGTGITVNGGVVHIDNTSGAFFFENNSSAGASIITNESGSAVTFFDGSTAGTARITNKAGLDFDGDSSAGSSSITNNGNLFFFNNSTAGTAQLTNNGGGTVDFSNSTGPAGDNKLTAGSIFGAGTYNLGTDQLTVLSGDVSGLIDGVGGSLVKVGKETLTLSGAGNTYSGGTTVEGGALELARLIHERADF
jgi:autotransporter-associated beta strand protein